MAPRKKKSPEPREPVARPPLKWAGGKSHAVEFLKSLLPKTIRQYIEPMAGGGALFFSLATEKRFELAALNDTNHELMWTYMAIREDVENLISLLKMYQHNRATFAKLRAQDPEQATTLFRAARMIYLNKTCFNGLYRVNRSGQFNVPFGDYANPLICDEVNLRLVSLLLRGPADRGERVKLTMDDYAHLEELPEPGDAVYYDPPYLPISKTSDFTSYGRVAFGLKEHERLADVFGRLARRGVAVMLSNSDCDTTRALYKDFQIHTLQARRSINSVAGKRGKVSEIVVTANCP